MTLTSVRVIDLLRWSAEQGVLARESGLVDPNRRDVVAAVVEELAVADVDPLCTNADGEAVDRYIDQLLDGSASLASLGLEGTRLREELFATLDQLIAGYGYASEGVATFLPSAADLGYLCGDELAGVVAPVGVRDEFDGEYYPYLA